MVLFLRVHKIKNYSDLRDLVEKSQAKVSMWGGRNLKVKGVIFPVSLDDVAYRVFDMVEKNREFSEEERAHGKVIVSRINSFYCKTKKDYRSTYNPIKKALYYIRNIFLQMFNSEWHWTWGENDFFELYTKTQYKAVFNQEPPTNTLPGVPVELWKSPKE